MSDIRQWLEELGLGQYADAFEENDITLELLSDLNDQTLKDIGVTSAGHRIRVLKAAATLSDMGYADVSVLEGGLMAWQASGLDVETGLTGVMAPPTDVVFAGIDRNYADMMHYLRWETALGEKYE